MSTPEVGTVIEAHGLQNFPMLNGVQGKVIKLQSTEKGLLPLVEFPAPHGKLMLKPSNYKIISAAQVQAQPGQQTERQTIVSKYPVGADIEAMGLKTQNHLNGLKGRIEAHHDSPDGSVKIVVDFGPPTGLIGLRPQNIKTLNTSAQQLPAMTRTGSVSATSTRPPANSLSPSIPTRKSIVSAGSTSPRQSPRTPSGSIAPSATSRRQSTISDVSRTSSKKLKRETTTTFTPPSGLVTYQERYSTFASWPSHLQSAQVNPKELSFAGFYHNPSQKDPDKCTCFACGYSLVQWSPGDVPWTEHSKHVPTCAFVVAHKASLKASAALKKKGKGRELPALDEDGYLKKRKPGKLSAGWDDRYFALRGATLYYYEEKALIDLSRGCECSAVPHDSCSFTVNAVGQKRDAFVLKAVNDTDRDRWVEALNGSKRKGMSKEDIEVLGGFETTEAEIRTQLVFDAANETTLLAGACIVNSLRISAVISCEFKERVVRCEMLLEEECVSNGIYRAFEKYKTKLRLSEHLRRMIYQDEKRVAYNTWRLAATPQKSQSGNEVEVTETDSRKTISAMEAYERCDLFAHMLKLTCTDLGKATKDISSLRSDLQTAQSRPVAPEVPPNGTKIYVHGLKNMAALNGEEGRVTDGQTLPDGTNAVLVELLNKPDSAPMFLKLQNIYTPPSDELIDMIKRPTATKLDEALAKITELEANLAEATKHLDTMKADVALPAVPEVKEVSVPDPVVVKELDESKEKMATLVQEMAELSAQLDKEKLLSKDATTVDEGPLLSNPRVVYSPVPTVGTKVVAHGLRSMESLNGYIGEVTEIQTLPDGTTVPMVRFPEPDQTVMLRRENVTPVPQQYVLDKIIGDVCKPQLEEIERLKLQLADLQQQVDIKPAPTAVLPSIGDKVIAHGLRSNDHLNGQDGVVLEHQKLPDSTPAVVVKFPSETLMMRMANCSPIPAPEVCSYVNKQLNEEVAGLKAKLAELQSEMIVAQNQAQSQTALAKAAVPDVGQRIVAHGLKNKAEFNSCEGTVQEHSAAPDGTPVAVVKFDTPEVTMMLKRGNISAYPVPEVVECVVRSERVARQAAEAELEMERINNRAAQKETEYKLPAVQSQLVPYNLPSALAQFNGKLATVTGHQKLSDGTAVLDIDVSGTAVMVKPDNIVKMALDAYEQIQALAKNTGGGVVMEMQERLTGLEDKCRDLEDEVQAKDKLVQEKSDEHSAAAAQSEEGVTSLKEELADLTLRLEALRGENEELQSAQVSAEEIEALNEAKTGLGGQVETLQQEKEDLGNKTDELQQAIDALKAENAEYAKQIKHLHDEDLIGGLSKQLMDTQHQCNELTAKVLQAEEARAASEADLASRVIKPRPGDEVMLKMPGDDVPLRGKVIKMDGATAACVKFEHDMTPSVGSIINLSDIIVVPSREVVDLLTDNLRAKLEVSESRLVLEQRRIKDLEDKLLKLEEDQGKTLEQNQTKLQSMLSSAALQTDKCELCAELQGAVTELLKKTEEERAAQRARQERMLQAIEEEAAKRGEEEARLYEMISDLQRRAEGAQVPPVPAPRLLPDKELHELFEEMRKDADIKNAAFTERERELLGMVDEAVREGNDPGALMEALDVLRKQTLQARKEQAERETAVLQAIQQRRDGEASLVSDMRNRGIVQSQEFLSSEQKMLDVVQVRGDQTAEYQETIRDLRAKIEAQALKEKLLLESLEKMKAQVELGGANSITPSDVDVLLESVGDPQLRALLEGLRRERPRQADAGLEALVEELQHKTAEHDTNEALLNEEISNLKKRLNASTADKADNWEPEPTSLYASPQRTGTPAYSPSPVREPDQTEEIATLRKQLADSRSTMNSLQAEYNQASEALASSSARVSTLQGQTESMQHLVEAKQADVENLTHVIKKVQQLPVIQNVARKMLQDIVPLGEAEKISWIFHYYDRDCNGRWSKDETTAVRSTDNTHWSLLCKALSIDPLGPGLTLSDVEAMYKLEDKFVLHADYETARERAAPGIDACVDAAQQSFEVLAGCESFTRDALLSCMAATRPVNRHTDDGPIKHMLRAMSEEAEQQKLEQAEHEQKVMALLKGDRHAYLPKSPDGDVKYALESLSKQVEAQRGELVEFQRNMSPMRGAEPQTENQALQKEVAVLQLKVDTLQAALDEMEKEKDTAGLGVRSAHYDAPSATPAALRVTMAVLLGAGAARRAVGRWWVKWRVYAAGERAGMGVVAREEAAERDALQRVAAEGAEWQGAVMDVLRGVAHGHAELMKLNGPVPIEIYEQSSRHSITAEEIGSRIELVKWKVDDGVLHWQMAEVGGILHQLQQTVAGVHLPADVKARLNKLNVGYNGLGAMTKRIHTLEQKVEWLRSERDKAVVQASTADARLSEYRNRIHKLRDEARQRNDRSKVDIRSHTLTPSPSPARAAAVSRWTSEVQAPSASPQHRGWE